MFIGNLTYFYYKRRDDSLLENDCNIKYPRLSVSFMQFLTTEISKNRNQTSPVIYHSPNICKNTIKDYTVKSIHIHKIHSL